MSNSGFYASTLLSLSIKIVQPVGVRRVGELGTQHSLLWKILLPKASSATPAPSALPWWHTTQPLTASPLASGQSSGVDPGNTAQHQYFSGTDLLPPSPAQAGRGVDLKVHSLAEVPRPSPGE